MENTKKIILYVFLSNNIKKNLYKGVSKMADSENRLEENVEGSYYVDDSCIACGVCVNEAPDNFTMNDDGTHAYVFKQPENSEEEDACTSALESCPVDAIGDDG